MRVTVARIVARVRDLGQTRIVRHRQRPATVAIGAVHLPVHRLERAIGARDHIHAGSLRRPRGRGLLQHAFDTVHQRDPYDERIFGTVRTIGDGRERRADGRELAERHAHLVDEMGT